MYLREEIQIEQVVRKLDPFKDFLEIAAQCNGQIINYSKIAHDVGVDDKTVSSYFQILEDTLLGFYLHPFHRSIRKRQISSSKFYLFDPGVKRALDRTLTVPLLPKSAQYGLAFDHWMVLQFFRINEYYQKEFRISYLKTKDGAEIDLLIERPGQKEALVEIKSTSQIQDHDVVTLNTFSKSWDRPFETFVLSMDPNRKQLGSTFALFWKEGLRTICGLS